MNAGVKTAARILQQVINCTPDGIFGTKTLAAVDSSQLYPIILSLPGLGGMRSYEGVKGVKTASVVVVNLVAVNQKARKTRFPLAMGGMISS